MSKTEPFTAPTSPEDVKRYIDENDIEFLFAQFVDMHGKPCAKMIPVTALDVLLGGAGFAGFAAACATTSAFDDNGPSLGVTRSLGYQPNGVQINLRRGVAATSLRFRMEHNDWQARLRRDDIAIDGFEPCRAMLGLS